MELFVIEDWRVRVFGMYGMVDIPPDLLYVQTITMSGCMGIQS